MFVKDSFVVDDFKLVTHVLIVCFFLSSFSFLPVIPLLSPTPLNCIVKVRETISVENSKVVLRSCSSILFFSLSPLPGQRVIAASPQPTARRNSKADCIGVTCSRRRNREPPSEYAESSWAIEVSGAPLSTGRRIAWKSWWAVLTRGRIKLISTGFVAAQGFGSRISELAVASRSHGNFRAIPTAQGEPGNC